jgi:hypothetical protein
VPRLSSGARCRLTTRPHCTMRCCEMTAWVIRYKNDVRDRSLCPQEETFSGGSCGPVFWQTGSGTPTKLKIEPSFGHQLSSRRRWAGLDFAHRRHLLRTTDKHPKRPRDPNQLAKSLIGKEKQPQRGVEGAGAVSVRTAGNGGPAQRSIVSGSHLPTGPWSILTRSGHGRGA